MSDSIAQLAALIESRRTHAPAGSYTASLFGKGREEIAKKLGEEAVEVIVATYGQSQERLISEAADLVYHLLVLLAAEGVVWAEVESELERRRK